jgi:hypothetical protein
MTVLLLWLDRHDRVGRDRYDHVVRLGVFRIGGMMGRWVFSGFWKLLSFFPSIVVVCIVVDS